jgi:hypothetical protein
LEAALRTHLADRAGSEDEVRPEECADAGLWDVFQLKIETIVPPPEHFGDLFASSFRRQYRNHVNLDQIGWVGEARDLQQGAGR